MTISKTFLRITKAFFQISGAFLRIRARKFKKPLVFAVIILIWAVFFARAAIYLDPDFGWHIGTGRYILLYGIPETDPFSYTMPSYHFVDFEWLTNVWMAKSYPIIGIYGLAAIYALLATLALVMIIPKNSIFQSQAIILLAASALLPFSGIRPQVVSLFFLSLILKLVYDSRLWHKWRIFIPIIMLFWVNSHGGFAIGIAILIFYYGVTHLIPKFWQEKHLDKIDLLVILESFLITFINPYGVNTWNEVILAILNNQLRTTIGEWKPIYDNFSFVTSLGLVTYFALSFFMVIKNFKKLSLVQLGLYFGFLVLGIYSRRHIPLWIIASLPITTVLFNEVRLKRKKSLPPKEGRIISILYLLFSIFSLFIFAYQSRTIIHQSYVSMEVFSYPKFAVGYLKSKNYDGQILNYYNWGGYLIWKYPEKKVFIDGRMPSWKMIAGKNESDRIADEYNQLVNTGNNVKTVVNKYNIKTVLWPIKDDSDFASIKVSKGDSIKINIGYNFIKQLINLGWKIVYSDKTALIIRVPL